MVCGSRSLRFEACNGGVSPSIVSRTLDERVTAAAKPALKLGGLVLQCGAAPVMDAGVLAAAAHDNGVTVSVDLELGSKSQKAGWGGNHQAAFGQAPSFQFQAPQQQQHQPQPTWGGLQQATMTQQMHLPAQPERQQITYQMPQLAPQFPQQVAPHNVAQLAAPAGNFQPAVQATQPSGQVPIVVQAMDAPAPSGPGGAITVDITRPAPPPPPPMPDFHLVVKPAVQPPPPPTPSPVVVVLNQPTASPPSPAGIHVAVQGTPVAQPTVIHHHIHNTQVAAGFEARLGPPALPTVRHVEMVGRPFARFGRRSSYPGDRDPRLRSFGGSYTSYDGSFGGRSYGSYTYGSRSSGYGSSEGSSYGSSYSSR